MSIMWYVPKTVTSIKTGRVLAMVLNHPPSHIPPVVFCSARGLVVDHSTGQNDFLDFSGSFFVKRPMCSLMVDLSVAVGLVVHEGTHS